MNALSEPITQEDYSCMDKNMKLERITPAIAERWLNDNKSNRKLRDGLAEKYAQDMAQGRWTQCTAPIVFYANGDIADGQHRLYAIIESNTSQNFFVMRGLPHEAGLNIDTGLARTLVDNSRISGLDPTLSNELVAVCVFFEFGSRTRFGLSNSARLTIIEAHREHCLFAIANGPVGRGIRNAVTLSAIARAHAHGADPERLIRFAKMLASGLSDGPEDYAAITLRNYLLARPNRGSHEATDTFKKIQHAISYFLRRRILRVIRTVNEESFPLKKHAYLPETLKPAPGKHALIKVKRARKESKEDRRRKAARG